MEQRFARGDLHQRGQHRVEVAARGLQRQRDLGLAQGHVQALLHHLRADAGVAGGQRLANDLLGRLVLAAVGRVQVVDEDVGVAEELSVHSSPRGSSRLNLRPTSSGPPTGTGLTSCEWQ
jgi:hypothetical protein